MDDSPRPNNWPLISGIAAAAALAGFGASYVFGPAAPPPPVVASAPARARPVEVKIPGAYLASANIAVEPVGSGGVSAEITAPATVTSTPTGEATVVARASGTITHISHRLGDPVRAGEVLAMVDSLDAASMSADRSVAAARADLARKTYARESGLYRQGVTPRQDMEAAQSALVVANAETQRASAIARAAGVAGNGRSVVVVAPISGRITAESAMLGAFVQPQAELFRIADAGAVQIEAAVPVADARRIMAGDTATIVTSQGAPIDATVRSITPTAGGATQAATVVLIPTSGAGQLVAGVGVQVRIKVRSDGGAGGLTVPEDAVQNIDGRDVLFVRTATGFVARPVLVGTRSGGVAQIVSGIRAGERVATRNAFLIKADMIKSAGEEEE
ncbi:efflux RND transporter periplasmic adaptor subunit [Sphingomonas sp. AR_OL41]|uniref:efflux RND transporter periplasmic adaptor subunit n=1 Tax=Sphingomonas sp. AR_OL41 TaxID=3042729 RepID=UPI00248163E1|nr:efflux RND transporter periplasmic adaptor subunit [Sphingomonas sp. AR_OL41]MDH7972491.1 efflux RND transporter periplasmic adaptor subunit [Sphingomonas sp. AR_OL41]